MMNWKGFEKKRLFHNFKALSWIEEIQERFRQDSRSSYRDLNLGPPNMKIERKALDQDVR
jgi:hypothetical protein